MTFCLSCFFRNVLWLPFIITIPKFYTMHCIQLITKVVLEGSVKRVDASPNFSEKKRGFQFKTTTTALCLTISWLRNLGRSQLIWYGMVLSLHGKQMGKKWKQWQILFSWAKKITVDSDCNCEIKRRLLLGRKSESESRSVESDSLWILQARILQ